MNKTLHAIALLLALITGWILTSWILDATTLPPQTRNPPTIQNNNPPTYHASTNDHPTIQTTQPLPPVQPTYPFLPLINTKTPAYS